MVSCHIQLARVLQGILLDPETFNGGFAGNALYSKWISDIFI